jgi:hypothetical protein
MFGDNGRAKDNEAPKNAVTQTVEATAHVLGDGMVQVIQENRDAPHIYIPIVRRMLDALERVGSMPALGASDLGLGDNNNVYGNVGLIQARGLRDDPFMAGLHGMLEVLQPVIDQAANSQRIPALRAVLASPLCTDEVKQRAADELSRIVMAVGNDAETELLGDGGEAAPAEAAEEDAPVSVLGHV